MRRSATFFALVAACTGLLLLSGCDQLSSYNENPNQPREGNPDNLLASGQKILADATFDQSWLMRGSSLWAQYTTQNFYPTESRYGSVLYGWNNFYNALTDLRRAKEFSARTPEYENNLKAVATITQVWAFQILTDAYGSIPFAEALKTEDNLSPAYTPQSEIYPALLDSLNTALTLINEARSGPVGDLVHDGDMTKWKRFANGLKMRVAIRMSDRMPERAKQALESANGKALQSNDDNTYFQFATSSTHRNSYYDNRVTSFRDDFDGSERFINAMKQYEEKDPRLDAYFEQTSNSNRPCEDGSGEYEGFPFGLKQPDAQGLYASTPTCNFSRPEAWFPNGPSGAGDAFAPMMYYDEVLITKAEAAARGFLSGDPKALLADAIEASVDFYGSQTGADISGSGAQTQRYIDAVLSDYDANGYEQVIGEQRWILFYMNNIQGWSTWRRMDFAGWIGSPQGGVGGTFGTYVPLRVDYPNSEYTFNRSNVEAAAQNQFGSVQGETPGSQIWWDAEAPPADPYQ